MIKFCQPFPDIYKNFDQAFSSIRRIFFGDLQKAKILMLENGNLLELDTKNNDRTLLGIDEKT